MPTAETASIARTYFEAWSTGKGPDVMRPLLDETFSFKSDMHSVEGREAFLAGGGWPAGARVSMLAEAAEGDHALQLYEAENGGRRVKIAEHLTVRGGKIVSSEIVVDGASFMAFMGGTPG